ncbi:MAG TPA: DUF5602 domain-containing protein, partial [Saprospiraceae bacterium]|nr:DUF5602 domain-containing protein [Saprospiraceae bacterium]
MLKAIFMTSAKTLGLPLLFTFSLIACKDGDSDPLAGTHYGEEGAFGAGKARTYVTNDDNGNPLEVGLIVDEASFEAFASSSTDTYISLDYPAEAERTPFRHQFAGYAPHGHEPVTIY